MNLKFIYVNPRTEKITFDRTPNSITQIMFYNEKSKKNSDYSELSKKSYAWS